MSQNPVWKQRLNLICHRLVLAMALLPLASSTRPAHAQDQGVTSLKATLTVGFIASQICAQGDASCIACANLGAFFIEAQGIADTSLGPLFAQVRKCFNPNEGPFGTYAGILTTTAPNGKDSLTWAYAGQNDNAGDFYGFGPFSGTLTVTGGRGKFAGARGSASFTATGPPSLSAGPSPVQQAGTAFYYIQGQLTLGGAN